MSLNDIEKKLIDDLQVKRAVLVDKLQAGLSAERFAEVMAGQPLPATDGSNAGIYALLESQVAYFDGVRRREVEPNDLQVLLVWLTGEGPEEAIYGLLASLARVALPDVQRSEGGLGFIAKNGDPRFAAAAALALPVLLTPSDFEPGVGFEQVLTLALGYSGIPKPLDLSRAAKLRDVARDALAAAKFWDNWTTTLTVAAATSGESRVAAVAQVFRVDVRAIVMHLESHLPPAADDPPATTPRTAGD